MRNDEVPGLRGVKCSVVGCYGDAFKFVNCAGIWKPRCTSHLPLHCHNCGVASLVMLDDWNPHRKNDRMYMCTECYTRLGKKDFQIQGGEVRLPMGCIGYTWDGRPYLEKVEDEPDG